MKSLQRLHPINPADRKLASGQCSLARLPRLHVARLAPNGLASHAGRICLTSASECDVVGVPRSRNPIGPRLRL
jgi:hypothetical protein